MPQSLPKARLSIVGASDGDASSVEVAFNPVSLQLQINNQFDQSQNRGTQRAQYVSRSTAKLTLELPFDTTHSGEDVRVTTQKIERFLDPNPEPPRRGRARATAPVIRFEWGTFVFVGVVESYRETLDFFSPTGVPLRSSVNLSLNRQERTFESGQGAAAGSSADDDLPEALRTAAEEQVVPTGADPTGSSADSNSTPGSGTNRATGSPADVAARGGDPRAARSVAALNGEESLRFGSGQPMSLGSGTVNLAPPVAFASGSASATGGIAATAGIGLGASVSLDAGISTGFEVGADLSLQASAGLSASFSPDLGQPTGTARAGLTSISANVSPHGVAGLARLAASEGAFAGLRTSARSIPGNLSQLDSRRLLPRNESISLATDAGATFRPGGRATLEGPAGLRAETGASALNFDPS